MHLDKTMPRLYRTEMTKTRTRDEDKTYIYLPPYHQLPDPKKTRPGEWFAAKWFMKGPAGYNKLLLQACRDMLLYEVEVQPEQRRLVKLVGTCSDTALRRFALAGAEHVLPSYEAVRADGCAREVLNAGLELAIHGTDPGSMYQDGWQHLAGLPLHQYEAGRALLACLCTLRPVFCASEARACATEALYAIRADKRGPEREWQAKAYLKIIKKCHKEEA